MLRLAISYEPIQFVLESFGLPVKLFSSTFYFILYAYLAGTTLSLFLIIFVINEGMLRYSSTVHFRKSLFDVCSRLAFLKCHKNYRRMQILLVMGDHVHEEFLCFLIFVWVFLGSVSACMTLRMYSLLNLFIFMLAPTITTVCFGIALLLTFLGRFPNRYSKLFKFYCKRFLVRK